MSLWFVAFQGSTPVGAPIVGALMAAMGARAGLGLGAVTVLLVALGGLAMLRRQQRPGGSLPRPVLSGSGVASRG
jgi:hypothetical protein